MNKSQQIRDWYDKGVINISPESKQWAAKQLGISVPTVHQALKKHIAKPTEDLSYIKNAILTAHNKSVKIARLAGFRVDLITVKFNLTGRTAGQIEYKFTGDIIRYNLDIAKNNLDEFIKRTPQHEISHHIAKHTYDTNGHGAIWKDIMKRVFGLKPSRCHSYDMEGVKIRRKRRIKYVCNCKTYNLSSIRHNRIQRGTHQYTCMKCGSLLVPKK